MVNMLNSWRTCSILDEHTQYMVFMPNFCSIYGEHAQFIVSMVNLWWTYSIGLFECPNPSSASKDTAPKLQKSDTRYEAAWSQILTIRGYFSTRWDGIWDLTASHTTHPPMTKPCLTTSSNNVAANYYCQQCFVSWFQKNIQSMLKLTVKNIYVNEYLESTLKLFL